MLLLCHAHHIGQLLFASNRTRRTNDTRLITRPATAGEQYYCLRAIVGVNRPMQGGVHYDLTTSVFDVLVEVDFIGIC